MTEKEQNLSLEEFSPAKAELSLLAGRAKAVDVKDVALVHEVRIELRDARVAVTKRGKELRDGALKFQKEVIKRENELVAIIEPEEERLKVIDEENKLREEMEKRRDELPSRLDALVAIGDEAVNDEEELLAMDDNEFNAYRLRRIEAKLIADKAADEQRRIIGLEEREAKAREDERVRREKQDKEDAERKAKQEAEDRIRREKQAEEDRLNAEKRLAEAAKFAEEAKRIAAEKAVVEAEKARIAAEEKGRKDAEEEQRRQLELKEREAAAESEKEEARMKEKRYQDWLDSVSKGNDGVVVQWIDGIAHAYKLVGTYDPRKE